MPDVERAMRELVSTDDGRPLPEPGLIWLRAAAQARLIRCEQATRSLRGAERLASAGCAIGAAAGLAAMVDTMGPAMALWSPLAFGSAAALALFGVRILASDRYPE